MNLRLGALVLTLLALPLTVGCAAGADDGSAGGSSAFSASDTNHSTENVDYDTDANKSKPTDVQRAAILAAVHARFDAELAPSPALKGYKPVFVVVDMYTNGTTAFFRGRIQKQNAAGVVSDLVADDYKGTIYEKNGAAYVTDHADVQAALENVDGKWRLLTNTYEDGATSTAYLVDGSAEEWVLWDRIYGLPFSWLQGWLRG